MTVTLAVIIGLVLGAAGVVAYDLVTGYSVADFFKDLYMKISGKAQSFAHSQLLRAEADVAKAKAAIVAAAQKAGHKVGL